MRIDICLLFLCVGASFGNSALFYGWGPGKEYVYHFESRVLTGIPEIKSQYAGLKLSSVVRIQSFPDYSLVIQFTEPKFITVNNLIPSVDGFLEVPSKVIEDVPESIWKPLTTPFEVHFKRGVMETLFVEKYEPVIVVNIKKALISQLQTDLSASRRESVQRTAVFTPLQMSLDDMRNMSFYSTMEGSLHGDCETDYTIHPLPLYQAREYEEKWRVHKIKIKEYWPSYSTKTIEEILKDQSYAEMLCANQQYYEIIKTRNFRNCRIRPVFTYWSGIKSACDAASNMCEDYMTHVSATRYIVCGTPEDFIIRKAITNDRISIAPLAWNTKEKFLSKTRVTLELMKVESSGYTPIKKPEETRMIYTLYMEYPESKTLNFKSLSDVGAPETPRTEESDYTLDGLAGFYPYHPMPTLVDAPKKLYPIDIPRPEIITQIKDLMTRIVVNIFKSPESCPTSFDVAGHIVAIAKALRPLSLEELRNARSELMTYMKGMGTEYYMTTMYLFNDVLSMISTNPSVVLVKELIESGEISVEALPQILQSTLRNIRTPTPELFNLIFSLVGTLKGKCSQAYSVATVTLSNLVHRACVNPTSMMVEFPTKIYGNFCNPDSSFIQDTFIPYLSKEIEGSGKDTRDTVVLIHALGKVGHIMALPPLVKVIQGDISDKPLIRSLAVYSLKRMASLYPTKVRPIILSLIGNVAEHPQVRIAAVSVLPWTTPTYAELHKIALRTWFEPSRQVTSFIYSTFKSVSESNSEEWSPVRQIMKSIVSMVKPVESGLQFSHNIVSEKFMEYLKISCKNGIRWINSEDSLIPTMISYSYKFLNKSWRINGLSLSVYSEGMDYVLMKFMTLSNMESKFSPEVLAELNKINERLQITKRESLSPEAHVHMKFMGIERLFSFNTQFYMETLSKIMENVRDSTVLQNEGYNYTYTKAEKLSEIHITLPSASGFPVVIERWTPVVFGVRGYLKASKPMKSVDETYKFPSAFHIEFKPTFNFKVQSTFGVLSPFTKQYIGSGIDLGWHSSLPLESYITMNSQGQVSTSLSAPKTLQPGDVELIHYSVKPYTFKKYLDRIVPVSHASDSKIVISGDVLSNTERNTMMSKFGLDMPFQMKTDNPALSFGYVIKKITEAPNWWTGVQTILMPRTLRYTSIKLKFNPSSSTTKELQFRFVIALAKKYSPSGEVEYSHFKYHIFENEIRKFCNDYKETETDIKSCIKEQKESLKSTVNVSKDDQIYCKRQMRLESSHSDEEFKQCLKCSKVCEVGKILCRTMYSTTPSVTSTVTSPNYEKMCELRKHDCLLRTWNYRKAESVLRRLEKGYALSTSVETSLDTYYERKRVTSSFTIGSTRMIPTNNHVKSIVEIDVDSSSIDKPIYAEAEIDTRLPEIKNKWNKEQMLSDDLKIESMAYIHWGYKDQAKSQMSKIVMQFSLFKTESQKLSVKKSTEFSKCVQLEAEGRSLSHTCEKVRHQATSVDKFIVKMKFPMPMSYYPLPTMIRDAITSYVYPYYNERMYNSQLMSISAMEDNELEFEGLFSRLGDECIFKYRHSGYEWEVSNFPLSKMWRQVLPLSLRNNVMYRLLQKLTSQQTPASCTLEDRFINTFDNATYGYSVNDCEHLLVKDCSNTLPLAVTVRGSNAYKIVKIIAGESIVELKQLQGSVIVFVDEMKQVMSPGQIYQKSSPTTNKVILEIRSYFDGVVVVREFETNLEVSFDGKRVEIVGSQRLRSQACGLCGDMNGEISADLVTPKECIMTESRFAAYTYMVNDGTCQGVPAQDKADFEKEKTECTKKVYITTPIENLLSRRIMVKTGPNKVVFKHVSEWRLNGNEICFSKEKVPMCEAGYVPVIGRMMLTPFACLRAHTTMAKTILDKIMANEYVFRLPRYPTTYSRMIEKAIGCRLST